MKVIAFLVIVVASVAAKGSGPYLPSGWKPDGPAFYLPSEIVKPSAIPSNNLVLDVSEASGSDSLREYGPPAVLSENVVEQNPLENPASDLDNSEASGSESLLEYGLPALSENISNQGLPDAVTEQNFDVEVKFAAISEATVAAEQEAITESAEQTTVTVNIEPPIIDDKEIESQIIIESTEANGALKEFENINYNENVEVGDFSEAAQTTESTSQDVKVADLLVQNIPDILNSLENKIISEQVEVKELNSQVESGSLEQAPEGFLEYGPPGFVEYGPPKGDLVSVDGSAARNRRFSPKFRSSKKH